MVADGLQDPRKTARWHNIYLGTTVAFGLFTALFASLFGGYYTAWKNRSPCDNNEYWVYGTGDAFDDACHFVGDDGLYAIPGVNCPSECDAWWHSKHPVYDQSNLLGRRLQKGKKGKTCHHKHPYYFNGQCFSNLVQVATYYKKILKNNNDITKPTKSMELHDYCEHIAEAASAIASINDANFDKSDFMTSCSTETTCNPEYTDTCFTSCCDAKLLKGFHFSDNFYTGNGVQSCFFLGMELGGDVNSKLYVRIQDCFSKCSGFCCAHENIVGKVYPGC
jgi:hypothetical protein